MTGLGLAPTAMTVPAARSMTDPNTAAMTMNGRVPVKRCSS